MGKCAWDYDGYNKDFLLKSDLTPANLRKFGIKATCKQIEEVRSKCTDGYIVTGGYHNCKHVHKYSIRKLRENLN